MHGGVMDSTVQCADLQELNYAYLVMAREMAIKDPACVRLRLGIGADTARWLTSLPVTALRRVAEVEVLLFVPRFDARFWRQALQGAQEGEPELQRMTRMQAVLQAARQVEYGESEDGSGRV